MLLIVIACFFKLTLCFSPFVKVEEGKLDGTTYELPNGRIINAFLGVPYAAPPIFENRFKVGTVNFKVKTSIVPENIYDLRIHSPRRNHNH